MEAVASIPDQLVDDCALVGPGERIRDQLNRWADAGNRGHIGSMLVRTDSPQALRLLAETLL